MANVVQTGQWGGEGGDEWLFRTEGGRIISYTITARPECVSSLEFEYTDKDGNIHTSGQYGTLYPPRPPKVIFDGDEDLTEIGGTVGAFSDMTVITSLYLKTNKKKVKTYGVKNGTDFSLALIKGKFDGFYGKSADVIDSIGAILVP